MASLIHRYYSDGLVVKHGVSEMFSRYNWIVGLASQIQDLLIIFMELDCHNTNGLCFMLKTFHYLIKMCTQLLFP